LRRLEDPSIALDELDEKDRELMRAKAAFSDESVDSLRNAAGCLDQRLPQLEPVLAGRRGEPVPCGRNRRGFEPPPG
jgi:hypothetical protein